MYGLIYKITNIVTGLIYIGQTTKSMAQRFQHHIGHSSTGISRFNRALREFGKSSFVIEQLDAADTPEELDAKEKQWIAELRTIHPRGYNQTVGGHGRFLGPRGPRPDLAERNRQSRGVKWDEARKVAHRAHIRRGEAHPCFGKVVSSETRQKQSDKAKSRLPMSDEHRKKIGIASVKAAVTRKAARKAAGEIVPRKRARLKTPRSPISEATRQKMRDAHSGARNHFFERTHSEETRAVLAAKCGRSGEANPFFGRTHSEETRAKIREACAKQVITDETRRKMSVAGKGRKRSEATRHAMSEGQKKVDHWWSRGRVVSEETKRRISEAKAGTRKINGKMIRVS